MNPGCLLKLRRPRRGSPRCPYQRQSRVYRPSTTISSAWLVVTPFPLPRSDSLPATHDARGTHKHGRRRVRSAFLFPTMVAFLSTTEFSFNGSNLLLETVTIFRPSGAQIVRKLDIDLKVSSAQLGRVPIWVTNRVVTLRLCGIGRKQSDCGHEPQHLHRDRIRVDGLGNARLLVVRCALHQHPEIITSDPIRELKHSTPNSKNSKRRKARASRRSQY